MRRKINNKGQMKISFGMIVSIILIIFFLAFAFVAIKKFLGLQDVVQVSTFSKDLQKDIDRIWGGSQGSEENDYMLSKDVDFVCFMDASSNKKGADKDLFDELGRDFYGDENMFFYPITSGDSKILKHIDLESITSSRNPYCIRNDDGKLSLTIKKSFNEDLVRIESF